ncbi:neuropeptide F isoform X4 [Cherax quadricarinatus]|uniref:Neuropeptide F1 n=2 Tax=Cherax quadricarinatus TaxID=27406 RepID=A0A2U8JAG5_CHEQU|nr:neuropeptide F-like isoform X3 [Cherax quadricarinatus]AWK57533.1 neuropeptide F1 [Cherax quadricarinatus]
MYRQMLSALLVGVVVVGVLEMGVADAKPAPPQVAAMADALKYLQELDKYYSQVSRPRFGKRSEYVAPADDTMMEASERILESLSRRR